MSTNPDPAERSGCPPADELAAFGVGRLADGALETVAAHVEGCAGCRALLSELDDRPDPLLEDLRRPPPAGLFSGGGGTPASGAARTDAHVPGAAGPGEAVGPPQTQAPEGPKGVEGLPAGMPAANAPPATPPPDPRWSALQQLGK